MIDCSIDRSVGRSVLPCLAFEEPELCPLFTRPIPVLATENPEIVVSTDPVLSHRPSPATLFRFRDVADLKNQVFQFFSYVQQNFFAKGGPGPNGPPKYATATTDF